MVTVLCSCFKGYLDNAYKMYIILPGTYYCFKYQYYSLPQEKATEHSIGQVTAKLSV